MHIKILLHGMQEERILQNMMGRTSLKCYSLLWANNECLEIKSEQCTFENFLKNKNYINNIQKFICLWVALELQWALCCIKLVMTLHKNHTNGMRWVDRSYKQIYAFSITLLNDESESNKDIMIVWFRHFNFQICSELHFE